MSFALPPLPRSSGTAALRCTRSLRASLGSTPWAERRRASHNVPWNRCSGPYLCPRFRKHFLPQERSPAKVAWRVPAIPGCGSTSRTHARNARGRIRDPRSQRTMGCSASADLQLSYVECRLCPVLVPRSATPIEPDPRRTQPSLGVWSTRPTLRRLACPPARHAGNTSSKLNPSEAICSKGAPPDSC